MKKLSFLLTGAAMLAVAACHTSKSYTEYLNTWEGRSEADLVAQWGAPIAMEDLGDGRQLFTYMRAKTVTAPGYNPMSPDFGTSAMGGPTSGAFDTQTTYYCQTLFTTQNDIIVDASWAGDACVR